jgi:ribosomal protein L17
MHRHGYQGRKLQLAAGPRRALIRGQLTSLVLHEAITTTEAKAIARLSLVLDDVKIISAPVATVKPVKKAAKPAPKKAVKAEAIA